MRNLMLAALVAFTSHTAAAQENCGRNPLVVEFFEENSFTLQSRAAFLTLDNDRFVIEQWARADGAWRMVEIEEGGRTCLLGQGDYYFQPVRL